jgi:hypothetical protein
VILPPEGERNQQWALESAGPGTYSLRNIATGFHLGDEGDLNEPAMSLRGSKQAFQWKLGQGPDDDPNTFVLISADSSEGLALSYSLLRISPPHVAILPPYDYRAPEWTFRPV